MYVDKKSIYLPHRMCVNSLFSAVFMRNWYVNLTAYLGQNSSNNSTIFSISVCFPCLFEHVIIFFFLPLVSPFLNDMSKKEIFFGIVHIVVPVNAYKWLGGTLSGPKYP